MHHFIVTVLCAAHIGNNCPIPQGMEKPYNAPNKQICETTARRVLGNMAAAYGFNASDFRVRCKEGK